MQILAIACALAASAAGQGPAGGAIALRDAREQARQLMEVERWSQARDTLLGALTAHAGEPAIFHELTGVRDDLRRCAFALAKPTRGPEDVLGARVVAYRPREGFVSLVYERPPAARSSSAAFPSGDFEEVEGRWFHPMELAGEYTLQISVAADTAAELPEVYFAITDGRALGFAVGSDGVPVLFQTSGKEDAAEVLAHLDRVLDPAAPLELTLRARPGRVDADVGRERMSYAAQSAGGHFGGHFGLSRLERCMRVTLSGVGDVSWIERRLDEHIERERLAFEEAHDEDADLPPAIAQELARRREASSAAEAHEDERALEHARETAEQGPRSAAIAELAALTAKRPDLPEPVEMLVKQLLLDARADEAERHLSAAIDRGLWTEGIEERARAIERLQRGPEWRQRFEHGSRHYVVRSDVSRELCAQAAEVLDTSWMLFERLLMRLPDANSAAKRQVYLFAGQSGYLRYAAQMTGTIPIHTAGLYSPVLKQLLIWNLPVRDDMMRTVRHEALHQYMDALGFDAPPWLQEGLGEYFELAEVTRGQVVAGQTNERHVATLCAEGADLVPLAQFLHLAPAGFYADASQNYAQAWALVHYLQHGGKRLRQQYDRLLAGLAAGKPSREAVDAVFGAEDLAAFERGLLAHVRGLVVER